MSTSPWSFLGAGSPQRLQPEGDPAEPNTERTDVPRVAVDEQASDLGFIRIEFGDYRLIQTWIFSLAAFGLALIAWWISNSYYSDSRSIFSLGFWVPNDRPGWLPNTSPYKPLIGHHYFGDFFQLYYLIKSHVPYTGHVFHTSLNPGYLLPAYLVSWLHYPLAGYVYLGLLVTCWLVPVVLIARQNSMMAVLYLCATTLTVPGLMALDLGQPQIFVYVLAIVALLYLERNPALSSVALGFATAIKPYMAIFFLVYLFRKDIWSLVRAISVAVAVNLALGIALVGRSAFGLHLWSEIFRGIVSYGSGGNLTIWANGTFLRNNSSLYGLALTLATSHIPVLSPATRFVANHYSAITVVAVVIALVWIYLRRSRLSVEMQWVYLTLVLLSVPSFTLGYAWLLLLVPFARRAMEPTLAGDARPGIINSRSPLMGIFPFVAMLAVSPYPYNIASTIYSTAQFGPNGNTIATPVCLVVLLAMVVNSSRVHHHRTRQRVDGLSQRLSFPIYLVPAAQVGIALICYGLSRS